MASASVSLVVDPRLPVPVVTALRRQIDAAGVGVHLVEVRCEGAHSPSGEHAELGPVVVVDHGCHDGVRHALRTASDEHPDGIVLLALDDDLAFYEGRRRRATRVLRVPRGYVVEAAPEVVPLPAASPARKWYGDASPLIADAELERAIRQEGE